MDRKDKNIKYIVGIDEVGRGPIAGSFTVCAVVWPKNLSKGWLKGVKDSKKLTAKKREEWLKKIKEKIKKENINYVVSCVGPKFVDTHGISKSARTTIKRALNRLSVKPEECKVLLDGGLKAPKKFIYQETIIKGDEKESVISIASIVAKVYRDRAMVKLSKKYPEYGFDKHKGYGTKEHYKCIKKHGVCEVHRKSFLGLTKKL